MKHTIGILYAISKEAGNACHSYLSKIVLDDVKVIAFEDPQVDAFSQAKLILSKSERIQTIAKLLYCGVKTLANAGATVIILAANSVHIAFDRLYEMSAAEFPHVKVLSIVDAVVDNCKKYSSVAIFGSNATIESGMYQKKLRSEQITVIALDASEQTIVNNAISSGYTLLTMPAELHREICYICENVKRRGCDAVVLACTELSQLLDTDDFAGLNIVDSNQILAEYAAKFIREF